MQKPIINESHSAIAAVMVEFSIYDRKSFGVEVLYHDSSSTGIMFKWNKQGKVNKNDYKEFLEPTPDG